jgi:hypothetical protein
MSTLKLSVGCSSLSRLELVETVYCDHAAVAKLLHFEIISFVGPSHLPLLIHFPPLAPVWSHLLLYRS